MSNQIKNFSRHAFSTDQKAVLKRHFGQPGKRMRYGKPQAPFFQGAEDLAAKVAGQVGALVCPTDMFLEAHVEGLFPEGTTLVFWNADDAARKRGRHATVGMKVFELRDGQWTITRYDLKPTVEVDFKTGETFKYQK